MANSSNDFDTLNSHFKQVYADNIIDLRPEGAKVYNMIDFISADKRGGSSYHQPVTLSFEHGFSYGGNGGKVFNLASAIASEQGDAQVQGHEMVLRSGLSIGAVSRSMNSKGSFVQESKYVVQSMLKSFVRRLEVQLMYGQASGGLGIVESETGSTFTIEAHEWAAGIWSGAEAMRIQIYNAAGTTLRGEFEIQSVDFDTRIVTCDSDMGAQGVVATDVVFYAGAKSKEFAGIHKILENDSSTLFNIDAAKYSLWRASKVDVGTNFSGGEAVLSFAKVEEGIARAMEKGLEEGKTMLLCNPKSWTNLLTEQSAKRSYDSSYNAAKVTNGAKAISFASQAGDIEIVSSIYCKEGYAYLISKDSFERIGSSDIRFDQPGFEGKFVKLMENTNGYEIRAYCDQALFCSAPGLNCMYRYIKS